MTLTSIQLLTGHPDRRIRLRTAESVLAVPLDAVPPEGYVPKAAAMRLTRAMQASSISLKQQAQMLGYRARSECLPFLYQSGLTVEARTHKRVVTLPLACASRTRAGRPSGGPMNDLNTACVIGRLTRDPELRATPSGTSVCALRIAVNESVKDASGTWSDRASFFNVDVFGGQAEFCAQYLAKGRQVAVHGRLRWREWEGEGGKREAVSIVADRVQFIGPRESQPNTAPQGAPPDTDDIPY